MVTFKDLQAGQRFGAISGGLPTCWQLREDGFAEMVDRHGCVSFLCGHRWLEEFSPTLSVVLQPAGCSNERFARAVYVWSDCEWPNYADENPVASDEPEECYW